MALTINPAVSGGTRRFVLHSSLFFVGAFLGALATVVVVVPIFSLFRLGLPGRLTPLFLLPVGWAVLHDLGLRVPLPYRNRQVPEWFRDTLPDAAVAWIFGLMLGVGFLTLFTFSTQLAFVLSLGYLASFGQMMVVVGTFAAGKTIVLLCAVGTKSLEDVSCRVGWDFRRAGLLRGAAAVASLTLVSVLIASSL
jgi:hypothetical protein